MAAYNALRWFARSILFLPFREGLPPGLAEATVGDAQSFSFLPLPLLPSLLSSLVAPSQLPTLPPSLFPSQTPPHPPRSNRRHDASLTACPHPQECNGGQPESHGPGVFGP